MRPELAALPALVCLAAPLPAQRIQAPDAPWKTIQTDHYRIHYPLRGDFEPFALEVASRIEGIHAQVTGWVGYETPMMVDVLIRDPRMEGNGQAFPFLRHPFVELWKTPPEPDSAIGHFSTWPELLVTHELTHIQHLMRPENDPGLLKRLLDFPVGPLTFKAPRWVIEGYATVIEGRVTGSGRPHSYYRAALLREWAREGKLPDYGALNGVAGFRGGNMAYLVGSAYLEWLERREIAGPGDKDVLKKLWRKLAERSGRNFKATFLATFGFSPQDGYDRFRAELTADALAFEQRMKEQNLIREGRVFTKVDGEVTDLCMNPEGTRLMARVITPSFKGLRVWDLKATAGPEPAAKHAKAADPDIAPLLPTKKATWELGRRDGLIPEKPFWATVRTLAGTSNPEMAGRSWIGQEFVGFSVRAPDDEGVLHRRAKSWQPGKPKVMDGPADPLETTGTAPRFRTLDSDGLRSIWTAPAGAPASATAASSLIPVVRSPSAAWLPAPSPDGRTLYYVQLGATGCEIRKLDLTLPPLVGSPIPWGGSLFAATAVRPSADEASQLPPPVKPPAAHDYSTGETMWSGLRSGLTIAPSGKSSELGYGGTDLLGRVSWQILGAVGNAAGPRGAQAGFVFRGWRWAPSFQVFSSLERPSRQQHDRVLGFDRQRTGSELALAYESGNAAPAFFKPTFSIERVEPKDALKPSSSRSFIGADLGISHSWSRGEAWGFELSAQAKGGAGRTDGNPWQSHRGQVKVRITTPWTPFALKAETGRVTGSPTNLDRFHLGGLATSLIPGSLGWNRVEQAALPSYNAMGDRMRSLRAEVGSALRGYFEQSVVWGHAEPRPACTEVVGAEFDIMRFLGGSEAVARLAGHLTFVVGIHHVLSGVGRGASMQDRNVGTLSLVVRP